MPKGFQGFQKGHKSFLTKESKKKISRTMKGKIPKNLDLLHKNLKGSKHPMWQGDQVSYAGLHAWLKRNFGKANKCENLSCSKEYRLFHWALLKGKRYERKRENFWMLCIKCHNNYDNLGFKQGHPKNYQSFEEYQALKQEA